MFSNTQVQIFNIPYNFFFIIKKKKKHLKSYLNKQGSGNIIEPFTCLYEMSKYLIKRGCLLEGVTGKDIFQMKWPIGDLNFFVFILRVKGV